MILKTNKTGQLAKTLNVKQQNPEAKPLCGKNHEMRKYTSESGNHIINVKTHEYGSKMIA